MKFSKSVKWFEKNWYYVMISGLVFLQILVFGISGESSYIAVHDNLDLFVSHFKMLKDGQAFFAQDATLPMLSGMSRDAFASEFSLYNILYVIFPIFSAYMIGYGLKVIIGFAGMNLLVREWFGKEQYGLYRPIAWLVGFGYGLIPVFPAYGIAFTSIPLVIVIVRKIVIQPKWWYYLLLFCYPLLSYFSYFGFFILGYMVLGFFILWGKQKKINKGYLISIPVLASGYVVFEYRLFRQMLFTSEVTIRETMVNADSTVIEVCKSVFNVLINTIFHAQDSHKYFILPVCILFLVVIYRRRKEYKKNRDIQSFLWILGFVFFNALIYGLYEFVPFRNLFEFLLPPLTGFQFNRTIYFNPFLWYLAFFFILKYLYDKRIHKCKVIANILAAVCVLVVIFVPQVYNDFYSTCYNKAYQIIKQKESSTLNFEEFYSVELFDRIKENIGYRGEEAVAYGFHPAVLHYNGIATLDGYLGLYSREYKEDFRKVIAPALDQSAEFQTYFDTWGARAYIYSGAGENTYSPLRNLEIQDTNLYLDVDALKALNGTYVFSRIAIGNMTQLELELVGTYEDKEISPYCIYVYRVK